MIEAFKILNAIGHCDEAQLFQQQDSIGTRGHPFKLYKKHFRLDIRRNTFSQRIIDHWNNLSEHAVKSSTLNQLKSRFHIHSLEKSADLVSARLLYIFYNPATDFEYPTRMDPRGIHLVTDLVTSNIQISRFISVD